MAKCEVQIQIHVAWWLKIYLWTLAFFCRLHQTEPDHEKLGRILNKGVKVKPIAIKGRKLERASIVEILIALSIFCVLIALLSEVKGGIKKQEDCMKYEEKTRLQPMQIGTQIVIMPIQERTCAKPVQNK